MQELAYNLRGYVDVHHGREGGRCGTGAVAKSLHPDSQEERQRDREREEERQSKRQRDRERDRDWA